MSDRHVCTIYINATPEAVWEGLTDASFTSQYFHSTSIESTWEPGAEVTYLNPDRSVAVAGKIIEANHPSRLSFTWHVHYNPEAIKEAPSLVTFKLEAMEGATKLVVVHEDFPPDSVVYPQITSGWIAILSNLKTLLETGKAMAVS